MPVQGPRPALPRPLFLAEHERLPVPPRHWVGAEAGGEIESVTPLLVSEAALVRLGFILSMLILRRTRVARHEPGLS